MFTAPLGGGEEGRGNYPAGLFFLRGYKGMLRTTAPLDGLNIYLRQRSEAIGVPETRWRRACRDARRLFFFLLLFLFFFSSSPPPVLDRKPSGGPERDAASELRIYGP